jgi:sigma-B regulation protein RsbU (phosphoserine phosphatase)
MPGVEGNRNSNEVNLKMTVKKTKSAKIQTALYRIADAASAVRTMEEFYATIHAIVGELMYAKNFIIQVYDEATQQVSYPYVVDETGELTPVRPVPISKIRKGFAMYVLQTQTTLHVAAKQMDEMIAQGLVQNIGSDAQDWVGVPLQADGRTIGVLVVQSYIKTIRYTDEDVRVLEFVAQHIATALTRARAIDETQRLLKETEQRAAELTIINRVQDGLASKLDIQAIYDLVGDKVREIFAAQAQTVFFAFYDSATDLADYPYLYQKGELRRIKGWKPDNLLARKQIEIRETMFIRRAADLEPYGLTSDYAHSAIFVPLMVGAEMRGVVGIMNHEREYAFSDSDLRLLQTLVNSMSIALENARLWEQEKMYRKALERELEIGREIQAGFLPQTLPLATGWEIAASLKPARQVAGDFYDAFKLPDGNIALIIADVCDKGVGAALFMTLFRSLIRATANQDTYEHAEQATGPHSAAERIKHAMILTNNYIADTHGASGMFATIFFGILDTRDGQLTYINGGHEPPLITQSGSVRESLRNTGTIVGAFPDCRFDVAETRLNAGETLFAFTDGAPEAKNPRGEFFGRKRLLDMLRQNFGSAHELVKTIETELDQHIASATQFDDITLLAVRRV